MIWDEIRNRFPALKSVHTHVIKAPMPLYSEDGAADTGIAEKIASMVPTTPGGHSVDCSWIRPAYERMVIIPQSSRLDTEQCAILVISEMIPNDPKLVVCLMNTAGLVSTSIITLRSDGFVDDGLLGRNLSTAVESLEAAAWSLGVPMIPKHILAEAMQVSGGMTAYESVCHRNVSMTLAVMALMSCKNVKQVERQAPRQQRRNAERCGKPMVSWHELVLDGRGGSGGNHSTGLGDEVALHWVRGHFKSYAGSGLFGKLKGVYWWQPHLAGRADRVVLKDYVISAPGMAQQA